MATRLYFTANAFSGPAYPADANWNDITQCTTQSSDMVTTPDGDADFSQTAQKNSAANPHAILHIRYKYALPAGITLQGNIRGQHFGQCPGTTGGMYAISVRVFDSGTTLRANLIQNFPGALASGFTNTLTNRNYPPSTPIATPYTTVAGDVLVVEVGVKWFTPSSGGTVTAAVRFGDQSLAPVDLPVDETTGVGAPEQNSWIEFESVDFFGGHDDWLMTTSGPLATRLAAPSKRGVHHFDTDNLIETIYGGASVGWKRIAIGANGGAPIGTEINFQDTTDVDVTLVGQNFRWNAQALSAETDRTRYLRLTDDATQGCLLTAQNTFAANAITFYPPNRVGTSKVAIGRYGNIAAAAGTLDDFIALSMSRSEINSATTVQGLNCNSSNTGPGTSNLACRGGFQSATATGADLGAPSALIQVIGGGFQANGGSTGTDNFNGTIIGVTSAVGASALSVGTPIAAMYVYNSSGSLFRANATIYATLHAVMPTFIASGSVTSVYGSIVESLTAGSTRVGHYVKPITGGAQAYGILVDTMTGGTVRRALKGGNSLETGADYIAVSAGSGVVVKDSADGNFYRIFTTNGFIQTANLGATAPAI